MSKIHFGSNPIEATTDCLTGRAGIASFAKFLHSLGLPRMLAEAFPNLKKNGKGASTVDFFTSLLCWFMLGDSRHLSSFDDLKKEKCTQTLFGVEDVPGTAAVKRFLARFVAKHELRFRDILSKLFLRRIRDVRPEVIFLGLDSMVMNNDDASCRQGVDSTYKRCLGYHPLQLTWMGMIIDGMFRRGNRGTHEFENTVSMLERTVRLIRAELGENIPIIIRMDAGYCDEKLMVYLNEELKVGFQVGGRLYEDFKQNISSIPEEAWSEYNSKGRSWKFMEMGFKCKSWGQYYRAVLTQVDSREDGSLYLDFARPTSLILTNLGQNRDLFGGEHEDELRCYMSAEAQVELYQGRGAEELCHRGLKDFGFEKMPSQNYATNMAIYHCMLIGFAAFETFKAEPLEGVVKLTSYATTVRRKFIDIAAKITFHANKLSLKLRQEVIDRLNLNGVWLHCCGSPPLG